MKYDNFQLNDFLHDDLFVRWVLFQEKEDFWKLFLQQNPSKVKEVTQAQQLILAMKEAERENVPALNQKAVWTNIEAIITNEEEETVFSVPRFWQTTSFKWATSLVFLVGAAWLWMKREPNHQINYQDLIAVAEEKSTRIEQVNDRETIRKIQLEDGTVVHLGKGSRLSFPTHFETKRREVVLSGEAFFEVAENPRKPFFVYANEVITKVLGTSFSISALENSKQVTVQVRTGRVSVFKQNRIDNADPETKGLLLFPNQQAIFNRTNEQLNRSLVERPVPVQASNKQVKYQFEEAKIAIVLNELERLYGVEIRYNEEILSNCILTTTLTNDSLYDQLDVICQTIGATYKEIDAQIVVESSGCK